MDLRKWAVIVKKLYNETISTFLATALAQVGHQTEVFVKHWSIEAVTVSSLSINTIQEPSIDTFQREATVQVFFPFLKQRLIAVSRQWLLEVITFVKERVHDNYILKFESITQSLILFASFIR